MLQQAQPKKRCQSNRSTSSSATASNNRTSLSKSSASISTNASQNQQPQLHQTQPRKQQAAAAAVASIQKQGSTTKNSSVISLNAPTKPSISNSYFSFSPSESCDNLPKQRSITSVQYQQPQQQKQEQQVNHQKKQQQQQQQRHPPKHLELPLPFFAQIPPIHSGSNSTASTSAPYFVQPHQVTPASHQPTATFSYTYTSISSAQETPKFMQCGNETPAEIFNEDDNSDNYSFRPLFGRANNAAQNQIQQEKYEAKNSLLSSEDSSSILLQEQKNMNSGENNDSLMQSGPKFNKRVITLSQESSQPKELMMITNESTTQSCRNFEGGSSNTGVWLSQFVKLDDRNQINSQITHSQVNQNLIIANNRASVTSKKPLACATKVTLNGYAQLATATNSTTMSSGISSLVASTTNASQQCLSQASYQQPQQQQNSSRLKQKEYNFYEFLGNVNNSTRHKQPNILNEVIDVSLPNNNNNNNNNNSINNSCISGIIANKSADTLSRQRYLESLRNSFMQSQIQKRKAMNMNNNSYSNLNSSCSSAVNSTTTETKKCLVQSQSVTSSGAFQKLSSLLSKQQQQVIVNRSVDRLSQSSSTKIKSVERHSIGPTDSENRKNKKLGMNSSCSQNLRKSVEGSKSDKSPKRPKSSLHGNYVNENIPQCDQTYIAKSNQQQVKTEKDSQKSIQQQQQQQQQQSYNKKPTKNPLQEILSKTSPQNRVKATF